MRAPAPGHGPGHSVHVRPCLLMRLVLRKRKGTGPGPFPDGGAVHPHLHRLSHCQDLGGTGEAGDGPGGCGRSGGRGGRLRPFYAAFLSSFWKQEKRRAIRFRTPRPLFCPHRSSPAPGHGPAPHGQPAGHEPSPEPGGHSDPCPPGAFRPFPVPGLKRLRRPHGNGPAGWCQARE